MNGFCNCSSLCTEQSFFLGGLKMITRIVWLISGPRFKPKNFRLW